MPLELSNRVRAALRAVPDYPKPGIVFQDITPVLQNGTLLRDVVRAMAVSVAGRGVSHILGIEARGFILGAGLAHELGVGFLPARKPGKLPWETVSESYQLEYGWDALEAHRDACPPGSKILIVDDVLATGGTAQAAGTLVRQLGGDLVGWCFLLELTFLSGRSRLTGAPVDAIVAL